MTQECPSCGRASEFQNGVCFGCGARLDASGRRPDIPPQRAGGARRRPRLLLALAGIAAAIVIVIVAAGGSSSDRSGTSTPGAVTSSSGDSSLVDDLITTTGADGKTYRCSPSVVDSIDSARDVVTRREAVLKQLRAAVRRLVRKYPDGRAPSAVVSRYGTLVRREKAQLRTTNRAIDDYNALLVSLCEG